MKKTCLAVLFSGFSLSAYAQGQLAGEVLIGYAEQKASDAPLFYATGSDISIGLRGAFLFNDYLAFELGYFNYGDAEDSFIDSEGDLINDRLNSRAFQFGVRGSLPLHNGLALYVRGGVASWKVRLEESNDAFPGELLTWRDSGTDLYYGLGAQFDMSPAMFVGLEYAHSKPSVNFDGTSVDYKISNIAVSVGYRF